MSELVVPLLYVLLAWWFSTGLIVFLDSLPRRTYRWSLLGASVVTALAVAAVLTSSTRTDAGGAYLGFTGGLVVWGWLEMTYLMGFLTGPWTRPCPRDARGLRRFLLAIGTSLWHELAVVACGVALLAVTAGAPNRTAAWTFLVLWLMRWSSKLNIYLGVPNLNEEFLPEQLDYLKSFITRRAMNWLFPVAVTVATLVTGALVAAALAAPPGSHTASACALLAALSALGLLEHWFLVLPLEDAALWRWALTLRRRERDDSPGIAATVGVAKELEGGAR
ncbi:MAG: putative photosynthetic complex assembly protein PuhE [Gammaproteobacteria bacterium]